MRKHYNPSLSTITVIFIILFIITQALNYIYNRNINFILFSSGVWTLTYVSAIIYSKIVEFLTLFILHVQKLRYAIIVFPLAPPLYILSEWPYTNYYRWHLVKYGDFFNALFIIDICVIIGLTAILSVIFYSKKYQQALANITKSITDSAPSSSNSILLEPELLLGRGNTIVDRVIKSLFFRAYRSEKTAKLSLGLTVLLVVIGGGISIGTIALDQFSKLRQLEKVRQEMLSIINSIDTTTTFIISEQTPDYKIYVFRKDSTIAKSVKESIERTFGTLDDTKNYKQLLENIQKKESYNLSEIIMRVAIAALAFFLAQVFLRIYKYNQQQSSSLLTKVEALELYNYPNSDMKKLQEILASKIEENPRFGNTPSTPIEQIINIADKAKSNGTAS